MRKFKSLFLMAVLLIVAAGCGKKHEISLSPTEYEFEPRGGELTVEVTSNGDWNVEKIPDWVVPTMTSGNKNASIVIMAMPNIGNAVREGVFEVSTSDKSAQLHLSQGFVEEESLSVLPDSIVADCQGGEFELQILSNCAWCLSELSQMYSWISVYPTSGEGSQTVKVTISKYVEEGESASRNAMLLFAGSQTLVKVKVTQTYGGEIAASVDPKSLHFVAEGDSQQLEVTCASNWTVSASAPWLSVSAAGGSGNAQITVTAEKNELYQSRLGTVVFAFEAGQNITVTASQDAAVDPHHLDVLPVEVNFDKQGGSAEITVSCNEVWKTDCLEDWISLTASIGEGDGSFEIIADENIMNTPRNATVNVVSGVIEKHIQVHQEAGDEAPYVTLNVDTLYVDASETVANIEVSSNVAWTVRGVNWAEPIQNSGEGDGTFPLKIHANYEATPRTCTVWVSALGAMASFVVVQSAFVYTLETSVTEIAASADGLKTEIQVFSNQNWTVSKGAPWIQYEPATGTNDGAFTVVVEPNVSLRERSAEIYVTGENDGLVIIQVNQLHAE